MICQHPLIVIGLPVYNEAGFIGQTVASLKTQSFENFRVLISDNCSTDESWSIINNAVKGDDRFVCVQQSNNLGSAGNFNFLLRNSSSSFFMWLGAHDLLAPDYLATLLPVLQGDSQVSLAYSFVKWIDHDNNVLRTTDGGGFLYTDEDEISRYLRCIRGPWGECTAVNNIFRRSAIPQIGFQPYPSTDHCIIAGAQLYGYFYRHPGALYFRRHFEKTTSGYLTKLTGNPVVEKSLKSLPIVRWRLALEYMRLYHQFHAPWHKKLIRFPALVYSVVVGNQLHKAWPLWVLTKLNLR